MEAILQRVRRRSVVPTTRRLLLPLCLAGALLATGVPSASAAEKSIWGPTPNFPAGNSNCPPGGSCSAFPMYAQLGVQNFQMQIPWDQVARSRPANPRDPNDPAYRWTGGMDSTIQQAAQHGISVTVMVQGTPAWANGGKPRSWVPDNVQDYADFMYAISQRFPTVHRWMIWGEVNYGANFQPMPAHSPVGPRAYALLLDAAYGALKRANPSNIVIGGNTLNVDSPVSVPEFIQGLRIGDGKRAYPPRVDWWGHNPFEGRFPNLASGPVGSNIGLSDADTLHRLLKDAYVGKKKKKRKKKARRSAQVSTNVAQVAKKKCKMKKGKKSATIAKKKKKCKKKRRGTTPQLWFSEYTVLSRPAHFWGGFHVSEPEQAQWLTAAYQLADSVPYIKGLGWYRLDDQDAAIPGGAAWGLMTYTGERKPAFAAYQTAR
jgi:hypothetical protein